jgi:hypothetical protein
MPATGSMDNDAPGIALPDDLEVDALLPDDLRAMKHSGLLINVHRALLRSPEIAAHVIGVGATQFVAGSLTGVDREMVILTCGHLYQAPTGLWPRPVQPGKFQEPSSSRTATAMASSGLMARNHSISGSNTSESLLD